MKRFPRYYLLSTSVLVLTLLICSVSQRLSYRAAARSIDNWDIPELVDHLNRASLQVRLCSTLENSAIGQDAFLTTTDKDWQELSSLIKDSSRIQEWRGVVYCERIGKNNETVLRLWGDHCLVVGPFNFYGDAELLERIRAILMPSGIP